MQFELDPRGAEKNLKINFYAKTWPFFFFTVLNAHFLFTLNAVASFVVKLFCDFCFDNLKKNMTWRNSKRRYWGVDEGAKKKINRLFNWWLMNKCMRFVQMFIVEHNEMHTNLNVRIFGIIQYAYYEMSSLSSHSCFISLLFFFYLLCTPFRWSILIAKKSLFLLCLKCMNCSAEKKIIILSNVHFNICTSGGQHLSQCHLI